MTYARWPHLAALVAGIAVVGVFWYVVLANPSGEAVPASGGRYVEGVARQPERMNPLFAHANPVDRDIASLVFSGLVRLAPDGTPQPDLAERWEITGNGRTYVFHLRTRVAWHDHEPFTAEDVVFTFRAIADPDFRGDPALAELMRGVVVTARDEYTVEFRLEQAYAPFLAHLTVGILPQHLLGELDANGLHNSGFNSEPVGTGPYAFGRRGDTSVVLKRNPTYHLGPPHISTLEFRIFEDENSIAPALRAGEIDGALLDDRLPPAELDLIARTEGLVVRPLVGTAHHTVFFDTREAPFDDVHVRRALVRSVSIRELMAATGISNGVRYESGIARAHWAYSQLNVPATDAGAAEEALDDAGWERGSDGVRELDGVRLAFTLSTSDDPTRVAIAEELARAWAEIGAEVEVAPFDSVRYLDDHVLVRDFEAALVTVDPGPDPDPYPFWHSSQIAQPGRNLSSYSLGELDDVLERARQTHDNERRQELYALFGGYIIGQAPAMPLFAPPRFYVQSTELQGFEESLLFSRASRFDSVAGWYLRTRIER